MEDGRTKVLKGMKGYLITSNPGKEWPTILSDLLNQHGSIAAAARALNIEAQTVRGWAEKEIAEGRMQVFAQPPRVWKSV